MTEPVNHGDTGEGFRSSRVDMFAAGIMARLGRFVFPDAVHSRLSVLIFHRVLSGPDPLLPYENTANQFASEIRALTSNFSVLSLGEGLARLRNNDLPPYAISLTFDDGYRDNVTIALPILKALDVRATFFVASGFLDDGRMWNDTLLSIIRGWPDKEIDLTDWGIPKLPMDGLAARQRAWGQLFRWMRRIGVRGRTELLERLGKRLSGGLPSDLMLTRRQVQQLHDDGMEIGCHTRSHPILTRLSETEAREEILGSRRDLEDLIQDDVKYFAYPNGVPGDDYGIRDVNIVREAGFDAAFSTSWGVVTRDWDRFQIPRFTPWDRSLSRFTARLIMSRSRMKPHRAGEPAEP